VHRSLRVLLLGLGVGILMALVSVSGLTDGLELRLLDSMFVARYRLHGPEAVDPRICVIVLDEGCFDRPGPGLRKPFPFWQADLAGLLEVLSRAGVCGIGFDLLVRPAVEDLPDRVLEELDQQALALHRALQRGPVVLIEFDRGGVGAPGGGQSNPELHAVAADRGLAAFANLVTDPSGTVRRVPMYVTPAGRTRTFSGRLAELAQGQPLVRDAAGNWRLGSRPIPTEDGGTTLRVNFPGPPGTGFPHVAFSRLWERVRAGDPLAEFRGRLCLVGGEGLLSQDLVSTPYSLEGRSTSGVDVHAAALNTILTGRSVHPAPSWVGRTVVLTIALLATLLAAGRPLSSGLTLLVLGLAGYGALAFEVFSRSGLWLPTVSVALAAGVGFGAGYVERYLSVERGRAELRTLLGRYLSGSVADELVANPRSRELGASRRRRLTVLFSDINDFTPACENRPPEEVIAMLNRYFDEMLRIVDSYQGTLKQFVGDEIMVVFGAPHEQADHAARAVRAGLDMLERLEELARSQPAGTGFFGVKIGIHTGDVVVGNVGSEARTEWTCVGDDVNLASRIEDETRKVGAHLLVSQVTRDEAAPLLPEVEWISHGQRTFKGKRRTMEVFEPRRRMPGNRHGIPSLARGGFPNSRNLPS